MVGGLLTRGLAGRLGLREVRLASSTSPKTPSASESYKTGRLSQLGPVAYPHSFPTTTTVATFKVRWQHLEAGQKSQHLEDGQHAAHLERLCGMVTGVREAGKRLTFLDLESGGARLQVKVEGAGAASHLRRGDRGGSPPRHPLLLPRCGGPGGEDQGWRTLAGHLLAQSPGPLS